MKPQFEGLSKADVDLLMGRDIRVKKGRNGRVTFDVPAEMLKTVEAQRYRSQGISATPSVPLNMVRTNGAVEQGVTLSGRPTVKFLRYIRYTSPLIIAIHAARRTQIQRMSQRWNGKPGHVGWRVVHKDHMDPNHQPPESVKPRIKALEELLEHPAPRYDAHTMADLLVPLADDCLTLNHGVIEKIYHPEDQARVVALRAVDGGSVMPTLDFIERWRRTDGRVDVAMSDMAAIDAASAEFNLDLSLGRAEYVFVQDGIPRRAFRRGHLIVGTESTRTDVMFAGWPPGRLEEALGLIYAFSDTFSFNADFFKRGFMAKFALGYTGDAAEEDIAAFINMLGEVTAGVRNAHTVPFLPMGRTGEFHKVDFGATPEDMAFGTWLSMLIALTCGVYRMDPSTINAQPWDGGSGPSLSAPSRGKEIALAKEEGLQGLLQHISGSMLDVLASHCDPDLRIVWEYGDYDPEKAANVTQIRVRTVITTNEARMEEGKDPIGFYLPPERYESASDEERAKHDDNEYNWVANPDVIAAKMAARAARQGAEQSGLQREHELKVAAVSSAARGRQDETPTSVAKGEIEGNLTHIIVRDLGG
jgi:hypothetical protein